MLYIVIAKDLTTQTQKVSIVTIRIVLESTTFTITDDISDKRLFVIIKSK